MRVPFLNQAKKVKKRVQSRQRRVKFSPDETRIKRELAYMERLGKRNPRVNKLRNKVAARRRRSYGR